MILTPHTSLPTGVGFAVTAWNKLLTCPGTVTASQATTIAKGFMTAFECTEQRAGADVLGRVLSVS